MSQCVGGDRFSYRAEGRIKVVIKVGTGNLPGGEEEKDPGGGSFLRLVYELGFERS